MLINLYEIHPIALTYPMFYPTKTHRGPIPHQGLTRGQSLIKDSPGASLSPRTHQGPVSHQGLTSVGNP